ncbi:MAG: alpha/beta hydrolase [Acidobacteria bacterium]|nr:alpha/beta hydrolase [Acidobacteriota bacterium]MYJ03467.1 alpha/beta hydrolase [Acidobacteriota bacterium]
MPEAGRPAVWRRHPVLAVALPSIVSAVLLAYLAVALAAAETLTKPRRRALVSSPAALNLTYEDVAFDSRGDGIPLRGWFAPADGSDRVVVIAHGRNSTRTGDDGELVPHAAALVDAGFNALLFDFRAHGESGGVRYTLGWAEQGDLLGAVDHLKARGFRSERMGFWAHSMGAAAVLLASAGSPDVRNIVADSSFARLDDLLARQLPIASGLPGFFNPPILFFTRTVFDADASIVNPVDVVAGLPPDSLFVIHAEADRLIPVDHAHRIAAAAGPAVYDLWIFPGSSHDRVSIDAPDEYRDRVLTFFDEKLPPGLSPHRD